jgi:hypothetical protein
MYRSFQTLDFAILQESQQLRRHSHGHFANFVEQERAIVRTVNFANPGLHDAGESSALVSE